MRARTIGYWAATAVVVFAMVGGGAAELAREPQTIQGMTHLGYPTYFVTIIGCWKLLGGVAILVPGLPRLKEWAYAGIFFNMTGAAVSHAVLGDPSWHVAVTLGLATLALVSWALRPETRTLGTILPRGR